MPMLQRSLAAVASDGSVRGASHAAPPPRGGGGAVLAAEAGHDEWDADARLVRMPLVGVAVAVVGGEDDEGAACGARCGVAMAMRAATAAARRQRRGGSGEGRGGG